MNQTDREKIDLNKVDFDFKSYKKISDMLNNKSFKVSFSMSFIEWLIINCTKRHRNEKRELINPGDFGVLFLS